MLACVAGHPVKLILAVLVLSGLLQQAAAQTWSLGSAWSAANGIGHLANTGNNRGLAYNTISNQVFVSTRLSGTTGAIDVFDGTAGTLLSGAGGVTGANLGIDQIGIGGDGTLYGMPLAVTVAAGIPQIYSWTNWNSTPYLAYQSTAGDPVLAAFTGKRIGDTLAVTGSGVNTLILAGVSVSANYVLFHTADGVNFTPTVITNTAGLPSTAGNIFGIAFYTNGTFLVQPGSGASSRNVYLVSYPANFATQTGVTGTVLGNAAALSANNDEFLDYSPAGKMLAAVQTSTSSSQNAASIFSMTNFPATAVQLATTNFATPNGNGNATGGAALGGQGKTNYLYVLQSNNGLQAYSINFTAGPIAPTITTQPAGVTGAFPPQTLTVSASGTATLHYYWQATNTAAAGSFTNIPGAADTNFYTIAVASTNYFRVIVSNSVNAVTSTVAFVSLLTPITNAVVSQLWSAPVGAFSFLTANNDTRGLAYDTNSQRVVVASYSSGSTLYLLDGNTGTSLGSMVMPAAGFPGLIGGVDQVGVADDGAVYACNIVSGGGFDLYRWSAPSTSGTNILAYTGDPGGGSGDRWGDTMAVRGAGAATQILLGSSSKSTSTLGTNVVLLTTGDGTNFIATLIAITNVPAGFANAGVSFGAGNTFWATKYLGDLYEVAFDPGSGTGGAILDYTAGSQFPSGMTGVGMDPVNNILASIDLSDRNNDLRLFQLTGSADPPVMFNQTFFPSYNANGNQTAAIAIKYPRAYALDVNNGIVAVTYGAPATTPPNITVQPASAAVYTNDPAFTLSVTASGSLPLYYQWRFNGANISGATARTYTLNYPPLSAAGSYDVVVHNVAGYQTSAPPAVLTILIPVVSTVVTQQWTLAAGSRAYLDTSSYNTRGLAYDTNTSTLLVCDHSAPNIYVLDAASGSDLFTLNVLGLPSVGLSGFGLDQVGVADDGMAYAGNLADTSLGNMFIMFSWTSVNAGAVPAFAYGNPSGGDPGSGSGDRWGDTMAVRGAGVNTEILCGSYNGTNVVLFTTTDGSTFTPNLIPVTGTPAVPLGFSSLGIAFGAGDTFWAKGGHNYNLRQVSFNRTTWTGTVLETFIAGTQVPNDLTGIGVDVAANILGGVCFNDTPDDLQLYELSGNTSPPALFNQAFYGSKNANAQENAVVTLKAGRGYGLNVNNGIVAMTYQSPPSLPILPVTIQSVSYQTGSVTVAWATIPGRTYQVQYRPAVDSGSWLNVGPVLGSYGPTVLYTDTTASDATRFYRVQVQ